MAKKHARKRSEKSGMMAGAAVAVGPENSGEKTHLSTIRYTSSLANNSALREEIDLTFEQLPSPETIIIGETAWINVDGVHDPELVQKIGQRFNLHPLSIEDVLNTTIRPKQEDYDDYLLVILKMIVRNKSASKGIASFVTEQVSIVLGKNWVITFQEHHAGDVFDGIRARLRGSMGKLRANGADFLAYALIDAVVDGYFIVLEELGEEIEVLESQVTSTDSTPMLTQIHATRNFGLFLRRYVWPVRDVLAGLERSDSCLITPSTKIFLRDVYDHAVEIMEMLEAYREMAAGLMELNLSALSNRMNSVMMVLTTVTTIFMPLTFIAGVYGMNFEFMPELHWKFGYPLIMSVMALIALGMLVVFRRRKWI